MRSQLFARAAGFHANHFSVCVTEKSVEEADGVGTAADASEQIIGKTAFGLLDLRARFLSDDAMEVADMVG